MNLLCPNCQKPLTVPEQYAGQPMRCPLCSGTFTVPALPASVASAAPVVASPPPPAPTPPSGVANVAPAVPGDTYGFKDPIAPPPPLPTPASPASDLAFEQTPSTSRAAVRHHRRIPVHAAPGLYGSATVLSLDAYAGRLSKKIYDLV